MDRPTAPRPLSNVSARESYRFLNGLRSGLAGGIEAAKGRFVIMGDADDSYDFSRLDGYVAKLREGYDIVMGNRFKGGIERGAMPALHRWVGNPLLSFIGRIFCGARRFPLRTAWFQYRRHPQSQASQ